jgi:transcriptional regulator of acetoin/glycerol metabolism
MIRLALGRSRGRAEAARWLGIGRSTLYRKMREFGLEPRPT